MAKQSIVKKAARRTYVAMELRFKTVEQRELIRRAAAGEDKSMNAFIRHAAEKAAVKVLGRKSADGK